VKDSSAWTGFVILALLSRQFAFSFFTDYTVIIL